MKDTETQRIVQQLRDKTAAILQRDTRLGRDLDALNGLDDLMAKADTPDEDRPCS